MLRTKEVGVVVRPGDVFLVESGGGGGYGDPRQRAPEARAYDRENGFVTRGSAGGLRRRGARRRGAGHRRRRPEAGPRARARGAAKRKAR